jgi:hypothetical protein
VVCLLVVVEHPSLSWRDGNIHSTNKHEPLIRHPLTCNTMDPLSVTASIIACLQAANAVVSVCLDYRAALNQAPWGLAKAIEEIRDLRNVLESVECLADQSNSQSVQVNSDKKRQWTSLELLCSDHGPLQHCAAELSRLEKKLCAPKWTQSLGKKRKALIQAVGWQVRDSDMKESLKTLGRYKATITLALTADEVCVAPLDLLS